MSNEISQISEREREILRLVATGATNQQIAYQLNISINTVKVHLRNIFGKIGVASRTEATVFAVRSGLVQFSEAADVTPTAVASHYPRRLSRCSPNLAMQMCSPTHRKCRASGRPHLSNRLLWQGHPCQRPVAVAGW